MIRYISGILASLDSTAAVVDCGGMGFYIGISAATCSKLGSQLGKKVTLYTYLSVSEDNMSLYGFYTEDELGLFTKVISVSGIGPKGGVSILGALSPDELRAAIIHGDAKTIARSPGIGLKTAQKLIIELKDKLDGGDAEIFTTGAGGGGEKISQVYDTLTLMGFPRAKVSEALKHVDVTQPLESVIAATLYVIGKEA
ncbi:MAG: Holliday junction branch migration protein RuvA [Clostridiales bacterium]|nr:Holliday junction branch migration protein RuvA [Candidatus Coliplasma equi]